MGRAQPHTLSHFLRYYTRHNSSEAALQAVDDAIKYANDKGIEVIIHKM